MRRMLIASMLFAIVANTASGGELTAEQSAVLDQIRSVCNRADPSGALAEAKVKEVTRMMTATVASRAAASIVFLVPSNLGSQPTFTAGDTIQVAFVYSDVASVSLYLNTDLNNAIGSFLTSNANAYGVQTLSPTISTPGTYSFRLVGGGGTVDSDQFVVRPAQAAQTLSVSAVASDGYIGQAVKFTAVANMPATFSWSGAVTGNTATASGQFTTTGPQTATVTVTANGQTVTAQATANIAAAPTTTVVVSSLPPGLNVNFAQAPVTDTGTARRRYGGVVATIINNTDPLLIPKPKNGRRGARVIVLLQLDQVVGAREVESESEDENTGQAEQQAEEESVYPPSPGDF